MSRRRGFLLLVLAGLLGLAAAWSYETMAASRQWTTKAREDLAACRQMADRIEALRRRPTMARQHERASAETIGLIEKSAKAAGITTAKLLRISPEPPQRLGDTVYTVKPTRVLLKNVTLQQLVQFVHAIVTDREALHAKAMRISAPSADDAGRLWNVEVVLTYLIYEPPKLDT